MEFTNVDIDCGGDYVDIYSSTDQLHSNRLAKFCGTNTPPIFKTRGKELLVKFVTDDVTERSGFQFAWRPMSKLV